MYAIFAFPFDTRKILYLHHRAASKFSRWISCATTLSLNSKSLSRRSSVFVAVGVPRN